MSVDIDSSFTLEDTSIGGMHKLHHRGDSEFISASTPKGDDVVNEKGEDLGKIKEILLDSRNGLAAYAVLSFGSFLGIGEKHFAVPWNSLKLDAEHKGFVLNLAKDQLKNMPRLLTTRRNPVCQPKSGNRSFISTKVLSHIMASESPRHVDLI